MNTSDELGELAPALAKAQMAMGHALKDATNPHFRKKYSSLASCIDAAKPHLVANGICFVQGASTSEGNPLVAIVTTRLLHTSGQWIEDTIRVPANKNDAQALGSALSYARRYSFCSMVGISSSDEDDDGNAATSRHSNPPPQRRAPSPRRSNPTPAPSPAPSGGHHPSFKKDQKRFFARLAEMSWEYEHVALWCESLGKPRPSGMTTAQRDKLLEFVRDVGAEKLLIFIKEQGLDEEKSDDS